VIEDGRVFVTASQYDAGAAPLFARALADGKELWSYDFGQVYRVGHPSVLGNTVYVACGLSGESRLYAIRADTGKMHWSAAFGSDWANFWAPLPWGGRIYVGGEGRLHVLDAFGGGLLSTESLGGYFDQWAPAAFGGKIWTYMDGKLRTHDPGTGKVLGTPATVMTTSSYEYAVKSAPVFDAVHAYVIAPPNLYALEPTSGASVWSANGAIAGTVAVANGIVYALSYKKLNAYSAATGDLLWTFPGDGKLSYPPAVAAGFVYVASDENVFAVEIATHAEKWSAPVGGWLAIAQGVLVIARPNGSLEAFNLAL
jgi:outer membrane protein assembly factor BamB